jgi:ABC-type sugar transport system ATPase subunit
VLGIRPQDVVVRADGGDARLPIRHVERMGGETHVHLALGADTLVATVGGERAVPDAGELAIELPEPARHWFDAASGRRVGA